MDAVEMEAGDVIRTTDAALVNSIANDPAVRPHVGRADAGPLDLADYLACPDNVALAFDHGCFLFTPHDSSRYELHTLVLPEGRGAGVLPAAHRAFLWVFTHTEALEIVTKVPAPNRPAGLMARRAGFRPMFTRQGAWEDGSDVTFFRLAVEDWADARAELGLEGQAFHDMLELAKQAAGSPLEAHPHDEAHDRAVGLACLTAKAGQLRKAAWSYSRWARLAGYATIDVISEEPPVLDVRDALVTVRDGQLEVLECR